MEISGMKALHIVWENLETKKGKRDSEYNRLSREIRKKLAISKKGISKATRYTYELEAVVDFIANYIEERIKENNELYQYKFGYSTNPLGMYDGTTIRDQIYININQ